AVAFWKLPRPKSQPVLALRPPPRSGAGPPCRSRPPRSAPARRERGGRRGAGGGVPGAPTAPGAGSHHRHLDQFVGLDDVAFLHVLVVLQADTALEAGAHFADVVLEAAQAGDGALVDFLLAADEARLGAAAHEAVHHVRTGDVAG